MHTNITGKTIVFVHGIFMNGNCWKQWMQFYEAKGYKCYAPSYPLHEGNPIELRKNPHPDLGKLRFKQVVDSLAAFIDRLPEKPILIGHSMGGLAVQKLIELNKGVVGICIQPAPPKGIMSFKWSFIKANLPIVNPFMGNSVCLPGVKWFNYAVCNTLTLEQTQIVYDQLIIPESRNVPRTSIGNDGKIDFKKPHRPLLFIAGDQDHIIPYTLNKKNFEAYKDRNSKKDFKLFTGKSHFICGQQGWEEIAEYISDWITGLR